MLEKEFEDLGKKVADTELVNEDEEVYAQYRNSFSIRLHLISKVYGRIFSGAEES